MSKNFIDQFISRSRKRRMLDQGSHLFQQGDPVNTVFVVHEGLVELKRHQRDGTSIVLQRATPQEMLAEASVYSDAYHCEAAVGLPTSLYEIPKAKFLDLLRADEAFALLWTAHLAREVQSARYRSEILTRKTVSERLNGWLDWRGGKLPSKGQWKSVAVQIGVSPEALYRELAKRRPEG